MDQLLRGLREHSGRFEQLEGRFSDLSGRLEKRLLAAEAKVALTQRSSNSNNNKIVNSVSKSDSAAVEKERQPDLISHADIAQIKQDIASIWHRLQDMNSLLASSRPIKTKESVTRPTPPVCLPSTNISPATPIRKIHSLGH